MFKPQTTSSIQSLADKRSLRLSDVVLRGVLVLTLLFVQAVSLNHTHGGDLSDRVDCDICLKLGSNDDVLVGTSLLITAKAPATVYTIENVAPIRSVSFRASARAPPLA
jgi:predicted ThiF/HesA family dinucleotide-utilizing enzyme